jgi:hypothetical protein
VTLKSFTSSSHFIILPIQESSLYNYADDNTLSYEGHNLDQLITVLERDSLTLIDWFTENQMKANPDKFQAIAIGKKTKNENISFNLNGNIIKCEDEPTFLHSYPFRRPTRKKPETPLLLMQFLMPSFDLNS